MVLDPIPQSLPVPFFGSRPQPPTSPLEKHNGVMSRGYSLYCLSREIPKDLFAFSEGKYSLRIQKDLCILWKRIRSVLFLVWFPERRFFLYSMKANTFGMIRFKYFLKENTFCIILYMRTLSVMFFVLFFVWFFARKQKELTALLKEHTRSNHSA